MLLLPKLGHAEGRSVGVDIVEHVGVLISTKPLVFPVESHWQISAQQISGDVVTLDISRIVVPQTVGG